MAIAQNADPESGVTLEQLRKANGLKGGSNISSAMASEFERHSFKVIENALETHAGVYIKKKEVEPPVSKHYRTDFVFETEPYGRWAFECKCVMTPMGSGSWYRSLMTMVGILYSADDLDKLSFVFQRRAFQEQMKRLLDELNIKKEISTLLIEGNEIVEEYCTGHRYGLWRKEDEA